ncbi:MAG: hypothetical protein PGN16_08570 [Sphingomonas phyllosphaerae]|uniref:hypothetical protein n=1 Tax=Sphingomonas phyllosphaerae TaxID=257003 RepID=UPI002FF9029F
MSAQGWNPSDWLAAGAADLSDEQTRAPRNRIRYRIARHPLLKRARSPDKVPSK